VSASIATRLSCQEKKKLRVLLFAFLFFAFFTTVGNATGEACSEPEVKWVLAEAIEEVQIEKRKGPPVKAVLDF